MAIPIAPPLADDSLTTSAALPADATERPSTAARAAPTEREQTRAATSPAAAQPTDSVQPGTGSAPELLATLPEQGVDIIPMAPAASAPVETGVQPDATISDTESGRGDIWGYLAGLLALLGIGGGAIALRKTRTRKSARVTNSAPLAAAPDGRLAGPHDRAQSTTVTTPVPAPSTARLDQPAMQTSAVAPMAAPRPASRNTPAEPRHHLNADLNADERRIEEMIAQKPSRDNPFKTRANRKRRAIWLLRTSYPMQSAA
ncbi:hypothetical protein [Blastomonas aquatica]|uniref:LPXTG cell wall anchor domain-containing protein n=1 Tax=Blastomonas aquatica TaxID=1510276 RepID=A0ABQ1JPC5_9SPHN|nr:hypothetical protein [Blastomonas aquatica]GGB71329.1 hypothetical protein GCM10010833_28160 [Blastomonas aquatica]